MVYASSVLTRPVFLDLGQFLFSVAVGLVPPPKGLIFTYA